MSRRAFGDVVNGWPLESRVSSRSCKFEMHDCHRHEQNKGLKRTRLINDIEVVLHGGSRDGPEIFL